MILLLNDFQRGGDVWWMMWVLNVVGPSPDCEQQYAEHMRTDMTLGYEAFDQTEGQGFRVLAKDCKAQAVALLKNYIILNQAEQDSLRWHLAQLLGELGRYEEAILYAKTTLREASSGGFKWNDYVHGYVAYWERDLTTLKAKIELLESHPEHPGNQINARLLRRFLAELSAAEGS